MGLDADLGIDSIKRVEILAALQERLPNAPVVTPEHLGEIQTLGQIVEFLGGSASEPAARPPVPDGDSAGEVTAAPGSVATAESATSPVASAPQEQAVHTPTDGAGDAPTNGSVDASRISEVLLSVVADKTGYPVDMLDVSMNLDADLGIDSIKRVEILAALQEALPEAPVVAPDQLGELRTLSQIVDVLSNDAESEPAPAPAPAVPDQSAPPAPAGVERLVPTLHPIDSTGEPIGLPAGSKIWVTKSDVSRARSSRSSAPRAILPKRWSWPTRCTTRPMSWRA